MMTVLPDLNELYLRLPAWAQNWALDLKGRSERRIRFGNEYRTFLAQIASRRNWKPEQFAQFQLDAVNELMALATQHVPIYRELYAGRGSRRLSSLEEMRDLPIIEKSTLRERNLEFCDERAARARDTIKIKTTGTTGSPVTVYTSPRARQLNYAHYNEFLASVGIDPFGRRIVVGGRIVMSATSQSGPFWRVSRSMNTMYLSSYHISGSTIAAYARAIDSFETEYFDAYPSSMMALAELLEARRIRVRPPRAIITSAETLHPEQRELIERVFQAPIYDQYGAAEMCVFVAQCKAGRYHVRQDYGFMEILKDGEPAAPGENGDVLCTGFVNTVMPLIRYRIGDVAAWAVDQACDCGSATPIVEQIVGRQDDVIVCPDGRKVGRLSPVLKGFPVREAQYVQRRQGAVVVRLVKEHGYEEKHTDAIREELRKRLGSDMHVEFEFVDAVPRGKGGKFRAVISEVANHRP